MKKSTTALMLALAVIFSSQSVMATSLYKQDMAFAFGSEGIASEMLALSQQEMEETEGQNGPYGAIAGSTLYTGGILYKSWDSSGGNFGFNSNTWNNFTNNWKLSGALWAAGSGFVGGTYTSRMFKSLGYNSARAQWSAPLNVQRPIRTAGSALGFSTFGVYGATSTNFQNRLRSYSTNFSSNIPGNIQCFSCYRGR